MELVTEQNPHDTMKVALLIVGRYAPGSEERGEEEKRREEEIKRQNWQKKQNRVMLLSRSRPILRPSCSSRRMLVFDIASTARCSNV